MPESHINPTVQQLLVGSFFSRIFQVLCFVWNKTPGFCLSETHYDSISQNLDTMYLRLDLFENTFTFKGELNPKNVFYKITPEIVGKFFCYL